MATVVYPVMLTKHESGYAVRIPDFNAFTEASDLAEAVEMARDEIGLLGMHYEDRGEAIPEPFSKPVEKERNETQTFVDIDFDIYRARNSSRLVKKNCTIPLYLEREAEKRGLNFSRVLTEALTERLFANG